MTGDYKRHGKSAERSSGRFALFVLACLLIMLCCFRVPVVEAETEPDRGDVDGIFEEITFFAMNENADVLLTEQWEGRFTETVKQLTVDFPHTADEAFVLESVVISADPTAGIFAVVEPLATTSANYGYELEDNEAGTRVRITYEFDADHLYNIVIKFRLVGTLKDFGERIGGYYSLPVMSRKILLEPYDFYMVPEGVALIETARVEASFEPRLNRVDDGYYSVSRLPAEPGNLIAFAFDDNFEPGSGIPAAEVTEAEHFRKTVDVHDANVQDKARSRNLRSTMWIAMAAAYICAFLLFLFYNREWLFGRDDRDVPLMDIFPVTVPVMLYKKPPLAKILLAALLDLVYRGELKLEQKVFISKKRTDEELSHLTAPDIYLLEMMFDEIGKEGSLSADMITEYIADPKGMALFKQGYRVYRSLIRREKVERGYFLPIKRRYGRILYLAFAVGALAMMIIFIALTKTAYPLLLLPIVIGPAVFAFTSRFLTKRGMRRMKRIRRLNRALKDSKLFTELLSAQPDSEAALLRLFTFAAGLGKMTPFLNRVEESETAKRVLMDKYGGIINTDEQSKILAEKEGVQISDRIIDESRWKAFRKAVKQLEFEYSSILLRADLKEQDGKKEA